MEISKKPKLHICNILLNTVLAWFALGQKLIGGTTRQIITLQLADLNLGPFSC